MPERELLTNVPPADVEAVRTDFESEGAEVVAVQQPDGKFTVTASFVIDKALRENRGQERIITVAAVFAMIAGLVAIGFSIATGSIMAILGGVSSFAMAINLIHLAVRIRKEMLAIRLLEVPLSKAATAGEAGATLRILLDKLGITKPVKKKP